MKNFHSQRTLLPLLLLLAAGTSCRDDDTAAPTDMPVISVGAKSISVAPTGGTATLACEILNPVGGGI